MPEKKNNHITPKCLIREWTVDERGFSGVHVYELESNKTSFSTSKGKRAFSFAIEPYFYVPAINEERIYKVENWLASIEGTLAEFIRKINEDIDGMLFNSKEEFTKLLLALFSLKNRTKYDINTIREFVHKNSAMKERIQMGDKRETEVAILENLINTTTEEAIEYGNCEITVCRIKEGNIILSDRPFLHKLLDGYSFVALSPYYFISIKKTLEDPMYFYNDSINDDLIHLYNKMTAENARYWILSKSKKQLEKYIPYSSIPKKDLVPYYQDVKFLKNGYKII
jgi:hypothetical protein